MNDYHNLITMKLNVEMTKSKSRHSNNIDYFHELTIDGIGLGAIIKGISDIYDD